MLEALFEFITVQGHTGIERLTSGILSVFVTAGSVLGGNMGAHQRMIADSLSKNSVEIKSHFELRVEADKLTKEIDELNEAFEKEVEYSNAKKVPKEYSKGTIGVWANHYFLFNEPLEFTPMKLSFPEADIPEIYENGVLELCGDVTLTYGKEAKGGTIAFDIEHIDGDYKLYFDSERVTFSPDLTRLAVEFLPEEIRSVYNEHFKNLAYSCNTNDLLGMLFRDDGRLSEILDGFSFYSLSLPEAITSITPDRALTMLSDGEFMTRLLTFVREYTKPIAKNFVKRTVDGYDARILELTGSEYLSYKEKLYDHVKDDNVISSYKALTSYVHDTKALSFLAESELFKYTTTNDIKNSIATYAHRRSDIAKLINSSPNVLPIPNVNLLRFHYANSRLKHTIFKREDGTTAQRLELVLAKKESESFITLKIDSETSALTDKIKSADEEISQGIIINDELFDNKLMQRVAAKKGVEDLEIVWDSKMTSGSEFPEITGVAFTVKYKDGETSEKSSSAHLVDGSVYLPLRQLMENAGYEVSWDAESYRAYVTVGGKKTEMTGKLIDSKTYVKVRDFEKLGATVEYSEEIEYANAPDDFSKRCCAEISFK